MTPVPKQCPSDRQNTQYLRVCGACGADNIRVFSRTSTRSFNYESTALPTELPRLSVFHSSIARKNLSNAVAQEVAARNGYRENGNISQPIPIATKRNIRNAHAKYFARSTVPRLDRKAKVTDTTNAKKVKASKCVRPEKSTFI